MALAYMVFPAESGIAIFRFHLVFSQGERRNPKKQ